MKKFYFIAALAALCFGFSQSAEAQAQQGRPNVEFIIGAGAPIGGVDITPGFTYATNVAHEQSGQVTSDFLKLKGQVGLGLQFNFAPHWGIRVEGDVALYGLTLNGTQVWSGQLLPSTATGVVQGGELFQNLIQGFSEKDSFIMGEVPVMLEFSTPVGKSGNRFYIAAGGGIGYCISSSWHQAGDWIGYNFSRYMYPSFERSDRDPRVQMLTYSGEGLRGQYKNYESVSYSADGSFQTRLNGFASAEIGFRWKINDGIGFYTGLYARYGLNNFIVQEDAALVTLKDQASAGSENLSFDDVEFHSALTALAPSYIVEDFNSTGSGVYSVKEQTDHYVGIGRTLAGGVKIAFSFGKAHKAAAPAAVEPVLVPVHDTVVVKEVVVEKVVEKEIVHDTVVIPAAVKEAFAKVNFDFDKDNLTPEAKRNLDKVADWLITQNAAFVITGHCDGKGSDEYNLDLSRRRCVSVVNYLVDKGVLPEMLSYKGYGKSRPVEDNISDSGRAENRRVEIFVRGHNPYEGEAQRGETYNSRNELMIK